MVRYTKIDELKHHGIQGQKWGERHGPPYPLNRETHTKIVRGKYVSDRDTLNRGKIAKSKIVGIPQTQWTALDRSLRECAISGTGGAINVAEGIENGTLQRLLRLDRGINEEKVKSVNSNYGEHGTVANCTKCTAALEMMRRGYDVTAGRCWSGGLMDSIVYWFDGAVRRTATGVSKFSDVVFNTLGNNGSGALGVKNSDGSGHSVYCYMDNDGFHIADGQIGEIFSSLPRSKYEEYLNTGELPANLTFRDFSTTMVLFTYLNGFNFDMDATMSVTRLDTATPNLKHMAEDNVLGPPKDEDRRFI